MIQKIIVLRKIELNKNKIIKLQDQNLQSSRIDN